MPNDPSASNDNGKPSSSGWIRLLVLALVLLTAGVAYWLYGDQLSLDHLAQRESQLRQFQQEHPVWIYGIAFVIYVAVTGFSLPGAAGLTLLYGWFFGLLASIILVSFASTTGATIAFLLSRFVVGSMIQEKYADRLAGFNKAWKREGPFFLFSLRLIPLVPFFVINLVMGLTPIRATTFWWVSQLGMLPGTAAYVYAGSSVPDLQSLADDGIGAVFNRQQLIQLLVAAGLLALLPFLLRWLLSVARQTTGIRNGPTNGHSDGASGD
jgi:uncharacterized membrane protein YdjX (TVP38/TMEM64 family)